MKAKLVGLAVVLLLGATAAVPVAGAAPSPPVVPQVRVTVNPVAAVDVDKDNETAVVANGTVNVTLPSWATVGTHIYLNVTINNSYWPATISPMTSSLNGSGDVPFTVSVSVPGRSAVDANAVISVQANVSVPPGFGKLFWGETALPVLQYFGLDITPRTSTSNENFTAQAGKDTPFAFRLQNLGNGRDSFELHLDNLAELQSRGISVYLPSPVSVAAKVTANVNGNVSVPTSVTEGNFTLSIVALSTGAAAEGLTVAASALKHFSATPPDQGTSTGPPPAVTPSGKGFLPGFEGAAAVGATGIAAVAAVWARRLRRP
jgi:hypothetical protein